LLFIGNLHFTDKDIHRGKVKKMKANGNWKQSVVTVLVSGKPDLNTKLVRRVIEAHLVL
jgi:hypothetical protein